MEHTVDLLKKNMNTEFSMQSIRTLGLFPWTTNDRTLKRLIENDVRGANELKAKIEGAGKQTRYFVKGRNIIKYLERYGDLFMGKPSNKK